MKETYTLNELKNMSEFNNILRKSILIVWKKHRFNKPPLIFTSISYQPHCIIQLKGPITFEILKNRSKDTEEIIYYLSNLLQSKIVCDKRHLSILDEYNQLLYFKTKYYNKITVHPMERDD